MEKRSLQVDSWIWGRETILWGFDSSHKFTFKLLEPKKGKAGCLSLQYHNEKSECWFQLKGISWALAIINGEICTKLLKEGELLQLPTGTIHRLMGVTDDCKVLEPSTPDRHAADKTAAKDVIRLHCMLGRAVDAARNSDEERLVKRAIDITEEACRMIEKGENPREYSPDILTSTCCFRVV